MNGLYTMKRRIIRFLMYIEERFIGTRLLHSAITPEQPKPRRSRNRASSIESSTARSTSNRSMTSICGTEVFQPPEQLQTEARVKSQQEYEEKYERSIQDPDNFWLEETNELYFKHRGENKGLEYNFDVQEGPIFTKFMDGSTTNISYNCLERVIDSGRGDKIAYTWIGNEPADEKSITYNELHEQVVNFSAVLRSKGVEKGDTVSIYMPMVLEIAVAMLACARIGAIHSVVFGGFSADSLSQRILQAKAKVLIIADGCFRGRKLVQLKTISDQAISQCKKADHIVETQIVVEHLQRVTAPDQLAIPHVEWKPIDCKWDEEMEKCKNIDSPIEWLQAEDPLFVLYTSGSTGIPKGILHTNAGYMTYAYATMKYVFDAQEEDVYWCTADAGWITGHSYVVYGPLLNGLTSIFFEGLSTHPNVSRNWEIVQKHKVNKLYTSPTAIRSLMSAGDKPVKEFDRSSLKILATVGEPINPAAWLWLYEVVGDKKAAIVDTYWQTETGGHVLAPLPGAISTKPGSATFPFFGVKPVLLDNDGKVIEGPGEGNLCFDGAWPGISRSILNDHDRFQKVYFSSFPGYYFSGDTARRDEDGYYWIQGRVDDLMNVSGHLLSTAEIESSLTAHEDVVEAAVVAAEHTVKGHAPYAFVVMKKDKKLNSKVVSELKSLVSQKIGPIAVPDKIQEVPGLPKTRSGKVTRRILRKVADGKYKDDLGDTSSLVDTSIIAQLWSTRRNTFGG
jgi:acetyl-CoA synthetase